MNKLKYYNIIVFTYCCFISYSQTNDFKGVNFYKADKIAMQLKDESLYDLSQLSNKLTKDLQTDVEKFRAIYIWVSSNIENDYYLYLKNKINRNKFKNDSIKLSKFNKNISVTAFNKLLTEKKTVCTGYAYLIKELSNLSNIECEIINGFGRTVDSDFHKNPLPNHSWNAVQLNTKWYLCDATWSSGFFDLDERKFVKSYIDGYFLQEPDFFLLNHYPLEKKWIIINDKMNLEDFNNLPKIYPETFKSNVQILNPLAFKLSFFKGETIKFIIKELKPIDHKSISIELLSGNNKRTIYPKINRLNNNQIEIKFEILEKGDFDIHLKQNENYLYTWVVNVTKK